MHAKALVYLRLMEVTGNNFRLAVLILDRLPTTAGLATLRAAAAAVLQAPNIVGLFNLGKGGTKVKSWLKRSTEEEHRRRIQDTHNRELR